jgi:hypothetical protein
MHDLIHFLGLCGEPHPSILFFMNELSFIKNIFIYTKMKINK